MGFVVKNCYSSLRFSLSILRMYGFIGLHEFKGMKNYMFTIYWGFWFMFIVGFMLIAQIGEIFNIWGDIPLMTSASFLLFTNLALATKIINVVSRRRAVQDIIDEGEQELRSEEREAGVNIVNSCDLETKRSLYVFTTLSAMTVFGWAASAEKNQLPLRAWYPFETSGSPSYELTYSNQSIAVIISALVNVCLDTLVTSLIATCRCRLRLVSLTLRTLFKDIPTVGKNRLSTDEEHVVYSRLAKSVKKHEAALSSARKIQACFSIPILAQFTVSTFIICITAYQLAMELNKRNWMRIVSMGAYLLCMMLQVFLYCYQGNELSIDSLAISDAVYECSWYGGSVRLRRALLIVMLRSRRPVTLKACGFTTLSLDCFTSIIKASYTFFTVLRRVENIN